MPVATPDAYAEMLDRAKAGAFAYPAINVSSSQTLNAALQGFAEAGSDGILQVSWGGAQYLSGQAHKNMVAGATALAEYAHVVAAQYGVTVALHTDHCPEPQLDGFMRPLIALSQERVARGELPLFQSHMWDGSAVPLERNLAIARELLAEFAHVVAAKYDITVALHTDHCPKDKLDGFVRPLLAISAERVARGENPLFQSHMWDGSAVPIDENLKIAQELLALTKAANIILEVEIGVVGGEEDGVEAEINEKLYTSSEDFEKTLDALGSGENGKYLLAATFGNVHGVYKPGNVKLKPEVLAEGQKVAAAKLGLPAGSQPFDFVFHGGSGSLKSEIEDSLRYGVVKMNVDTDTQYAFTRPVAAHMFTNYDGVLKIDGEVGNKKVYDPRSYLKKAEASMTQRVIEACNDLHSTGRSVSAGRLSS